MFFSPHRLSVPWLGVCIALAGAAYCLLQVAPIPIPIPCPGTGCHLFQNFTFYGVSLWWAGVLYFTAMILLCLRKARALYLPLAGLALLLDGVLIIIMLATAPCISCLGAAVFMGSLFWVLRRHAHGKALPGPSLLFITWAGLFIAAAVSAGTGLIGPWQMYGPQTAERRVYFSPSCPACRDAIAVFANNAAFMPVAESESDYAAIYRMQLALEKGKTLTQALKESDEGKEEEPFSLQVLLFRFKLLRNKAEVLGLGFDRLPLIMVNGMLQSLRPSAETAPDTPPNRYTPRGNASDLPPELEPVDSCGETTEPCAPYAPLR